jgi:hypothetical protein
MSSLEVIDLVDSSDSDNESTVSVAESVASKRSISSLQSAQSECSSKSSRSNASSRIHTVPSSQFSQIDTSSKAIKTTINRSKSSSSKAAAMEKELKRQSAGKFKHEEVGIILSSSLETSALYDTLLKVCACEDLNFNGIFYADSFTNHCIRFTYRPKVLGGRTTIGSLHSTVLPFAVVLYPVAEFIRLADTSSSSPHCFPELADALDQAGQVLCNLDGCPFDTRITYVLVDLDGEMLKYRKVR